MSGDERGTLWTLLVTFCIVINRCTETFWSPCKHKWLNNIRAQKNDCWTLKALLPIHTFKTTRTITQRHIPQDKHLHMSGTILLLLFTPDRKIANSDYQLGQVCLSVSPHGTTRLPMDGFSWNLISGHFSKIFRENYSCITIWHE
jgi:hypothetical protein